ncbi:ester cyclase [Candidatus Protofrankia californiensis]|uniref:ester cyclase n=1 Tax=Candidatus Protofrankia californiensis TaxID=1839754 RepID=UPI0010414C23|nr:ester cyclase [Candidatus Protofrankia californiensis]
MTTTDHLAGTDTAVATSSVETNKTVARRLYEEVVNEGRLDLLDDLLAEEASRRTGGGTFGRDSFASHVTELRANVTDLKATVTNLVAEGDRVVVFWRIQGIHSGEVWGVPGTGNTIDGTSISLITFRDSKVIDYVVTPDRLTILQQLGAIPA